MLSYGPCRKKTFFFWGGGGVANNTGTGQPVHPRSLISAFVIRFFESFLCKLAMDDISIF